MIHLYLCHIWQQCNGLRLIYMQLPLFKQLFVIFYFCQYYLFCSKSCAGSAYLMYIRLVHHNLCTGKWLPRERETLSLVHTSVRTDVCWLAAWCCCQNSCMFFGVWQTSLPSFVLDAASEVNELFIVSLCYVYGLQFTVMLCVVFKFCYLCLVLFALYLQFYVGVHV